MDFIYLFYFNIMLLWSGHTIKHNTYITCMEMQQFCCVSYLRRNCLSRTRSSVWQWYQRKGYRWLVCRCSYLSSRPRTSARTVRMVWSFAVNWGCWSGKNGTRCVCEIGPTMFRLGSYGGHRVKVSNVVKTDTIWSKKYGCQIWTLYFV